MDGRTLLILRLRATRSHARALAVAETVAALAHLGCAPEPGGPLSEQRQIAWVSIDQDKVDALPDEIPPLGYVSTIDVLESPYRDGGVSVRWKGRSYRLRRCYADDTEELRELAPDRRTFVLDGPAGPREVVGYRGTGGNVLGRRGLPVVDARLLANLTGRLRGARILDPFAGAGGVVVAVQAAGGTCYTADIDRIVALGLAKLNDGRHVVADAEHLPFRDAAFDAIATEVPFDASADEGVKQAFIASAQLLRENGRVVVMCSRSQAAQLRSAPIGLSLVIDEAVLRRKLSLRVLAWNRAPAGSSPSDAGPRVPREG